MNFDVIIIGLVQGFTEFLPVSSSGHLALAKIFLGIELPPLNYDLVLHVSTTLATILFFFSDILTFLGQWCTGFVNAEARKKLGWHIGWAVILGTLITGVIGFALKNFAEEASLNSLLVGIGLVITGILLVISRWIREGYGRVALMDGVYVGIAQGIAVLPGISRSGMTIMAGLAAGLSKESAFRFSFLLSIPAIIGATLVQALEIGGWHNFVSTLPSGWFFGAVCAFLSGLLSLFILKKLVIASKWWFFGIYCLIAGLSAIGITYLGAW
ncbi:MAG: undecaprenyl-diphosphate phosphatase [Synergistaceae bacterium]|nr:undecaprenyl-diphosphate phosphatase [Synergistaceae bacterium]